MRKPDSTKNSCTPAQPEVQAQPRPPKWKATTITAANARSPSQAGNRRMARYSA